MNNANAVLVRAAALERRYVDRQPTGDLAAILAVAGAPQSYWNRIVRRDLLDRWERAVAWRGN